MQFVLNMRIGARLAAGFGLLILLIVTMAVAGIRQVSAIDQSTETILHDRYPKVVLAQNMANEVNRQSRAIRTALIADDAAVVKGELAKIEDSTAAVAKMVQKLESVIQSEKGRAALKKMLDERATFKSLQQELLGLIAQGKVEQGRAFLVQKMLGPQGAYLAAIDAFQDSQEAGMEEYGREASDLVKSTNVLLIVMSVLAAALGVVIALVLTRSITRPIAQAVQVAETVANGNLSSHFSASSRDETGQLLGALKRMQENLTSVVSTVRMGSESVATASAEIAQGNQDLSSRTESQASALEQTASSMEELSSQVQHNADNARQAKQLASGASLVAVRGGEVVGRVVHTMKEINDSSKRISDIISVIDGIAFQTNILALNAAVEAARAGEQGRGFAVVASEVRSLAGRSAEAAREIKSLINASVERVEQGTVLVDEAGTTMAEVVASIRRVSDLVGEISSATSEQSTGVAQVGEAVMQMDQVTQQNAALVEQMAAAASSLKSQAGELVRTVATFNLGGQGAMVQAPVRPAPPAGKAYKPAARRTIEAPAAQARIAAATPSKAKPASLPKPAPAAQPAAAGPADDNWETF